MIPLLVGIVLVVAALGYAIAVFNRLVKQRNAVADAWAGIDVQLTRRADLVPNLVEVVKGYRLHEQQTLEEVVAARTSARGAAATGQVEEKVQTAVGSLLAVAEAYPDLKANQNFQHLQTELATLEEDLSFARRYYNGTVRNYNTSQQTFPVVLFARPLGFQPAEYFQADLDAKAAPSARM
ncbi:MAG TPA: LemA family protein [Acidimicrobiales bacterium]|nr:LemA family protein [Acidimicrobiales bacterium]